MKLVLTIEPNTNLKTKALLTVNNAFDVLILMVNRGYITETDLSFLEDIFTNLFRKDLVSDIHTFINKTGKHMVFCILVFCLYKTIGKLHQILFYCMLYLTEISKIYLLKDEK